MEQTITITPETPSPLATWREARKDGQTARVEPTQTPAPTPSPVAASDDDGPAITPDPIPAEPAKKDERYTDPDTGDVLDRRTRSARRIIALNSKVKELQTQIADLTKRQSVPPRTETPPAAAESRQAAPTPGHDDPRPKESDFPNDWGAFLAADAAWSARQAIREERAQHAEQQKVESFKRDYQSAYQQYRDRAAEFAKTTPDFDAVVSQDLAMSPVMQHAIITSDHGPRLAYWLGQHPDQAARLLRDSSAMGPEHMPLVRDLLERMSAPPPVVEKPAPAVSKAPPPVKGLEGAPVTTAPPSRDFSQMSLAEYTRSRRG